MKHYEINLAETALDNKAIVWEMDEYLNHKRGLYWYLSLAMGGLFLGALAYWVTGEGIAFISIALLVICGVVFSLKKPSRHKYTLSSLGLKIGSRLYHYGGFKNFSLIEENGITALYLVATQRFIPPLTVYLPSEKEKVIIKTLARYIAYAPRSLQWSDRLVQHLRF